MDDNNIWTLYALVSLVGLWLVALSLFWVRREQLQRAGWLGAALLCWPLQLLDEVVRFSPPAWQVLAGLTDFIPVLAVSLAYRALKPALVAKGIASVRLSWLPLAICVLAQLPFALSGAAEKQQILALAPIGLPLDFWPVYTSAMLSSFAVLVLGLITIELVQTYHHYLPEQVVDPQEYRLRGVTGAYILLVAVGIIAVLLITAVTFGFLAVGSWPTIVTVMLAAASLLVLVVLCRPQSTSPSVLDYDRLEARRAPQADMRDALTRAEAVIAQQSVFTKVGLTINEVAVRARVDATTLAIALHLLEDKSFRQYVFGFRLDFARKVLLRTDANIAGLAKKLGLHSEQFMGKVLVNHLRKLR